LSFLDFGCGTGFASEQITNNKNLENKISKMACYDLSESMVEACKKKFGSHQKFKFYANKSGFATLLNDNTTFDIVTCNALLHHILEPDKLLLQFSEVLKKDGILIIGHEPNKAFYESYTLQLVTKSYRFYKKGLNRLSKLFNRKNSNSGKDLTTLSYSKLLREGQIIENFPKQIIPKLVDIHFPMRNLQKQPWREIGFNANFVTKSTNHSFTLLEQISCNHFNNQNAYISLFWNSISKFLVFVFPKKGADTKLIFKKI
jgi:ubiquinone/menaquinone biosynthesis C-methylase UbiE